MYSTPCSVGFLVVFIGLLRCGRAHAFMRHASIVMVGMRQVTASIGVAEQGYVEGMHATHGRSAVGGHACCNGRRRCG